MSGIIEPIMSVVGYSSGTAGTVGAAETMAMAGATQTAAGAKLAATLSALESSAVVPQATLSLGSLLSSGLTLASVGSSVMGGYQQAKSSLQQSKAEARALELSSKDDELGAKQEELRAKQEANTIMDNLNQTLAAQKLAFSGNGVDPSFGTPVTTANTASRMANINTGISRTDAMLRALSRRRQASESLTQRSIVLQRGINDSQNARLAGIGRGLGTLEDFANRRIRRG